VQSWIVVTVALVYIGLLFATAWRGDRVGLRAGRKAPILYSLSLGIYCSSHDVRSLLCDIFPLDRASQVCSRLAAGGGRFELPVPPRWRARLARRFHSAGYDHR
jgi:hypothetical protein